MIDGTPVTIELVGLVVGVLATVIGGGLWLGNRISASLDRLRSDMTSLIRGEEAERDRSLAEIENALVDLRRDVDVRLATLSATGQLALTQVQEVRTEMARDYVSFARLRDALGDLTRVMQAGFDRLDEKIDMARGRPV